MCPHLSQPSRLSPVLTPAASKTGSASTLTVRSDGSTVMFTICYNRQSNLQSSSGTSAEMRFECRNEHPTDIPLEADYSLPQTPGLSSSIIPSNQSINFLVYDLLMLIRHMRDQIIKFLGN